MAVLRSEIVRDLLAARLRMAARVREKVRLRLFDRTKMRCVEKEFGFDELIGEWQASTQGMSRENNVLKVAEAIFAQYERSVEYLLDLNETLLAKYQEDEPEAPERPFGGMIAPPIPDESFVEEPKGEPEAPPMPPDRGDLAGEESFMDDEESGGFSEPDEDDEE